MYSIHNHLPQYIVLIWYSCSNRFSVGNQWNHREFVFQSKCAVVKLIIRCILIHRSYFFFLPYLYFGNRKVLFNRKCCNWFYFYFCFCFWFQFKHIFIFYLYRYVHSIDLFIKINIFHFNFVVVVVVDILPSHTIGEFKTSWAYQDLQKKKETKKL